MRLDQSRRDGEAKAGSCCGAACREKGFEQAFAFRSGDAGAVVRYRQLNIAAFASRSNLNFARPGLRGIFEQDDQHVLRKKLCARNSRAAR